jgi:F0F1-type ATP synthase epsilon subunit
MSEGFNIDIVNPEKSFLSKENVSEVIVPAFEGEMGIKIFKYQLTTFSISFWIC